MSIMTVIALVTEVTVPGGVVIATGALLAAVVVPLGVITGREAARAFRETQARQRAMHPDPEGERALVRTIRTRREREERRRIEQRLNEHRSAAVAGRRPTAGGEV